MIQAEKQRGASLPDDPAEDARWAVLPGRAPRAAEVHAARALEHLRKGRYSEAANEFQAVRQLEPNNSDAAVNHATALSAIGLHAQAEAACREAVRLNPAGAPGHIILGNTLVAQGKLTEAVAAYRDAIRLDPGSALSHSNLGVVLADLGDVDAAIDAHRRAIGLEPHNLHFLRNFAEALTLAGCDPEAIRVYDAALAIAPADPWLRYRRGELRLKMGDAGGWADAQARHSQEHIRAREAPGVPHWHGERVAGALLLNAALDGVGDLIMGIRFAAEARRLVGGIVLGTDPDLARLLGACTGVDRVVTRREDQPPIEAQVRVLRLAVLFGLPPATPGGDGPYLSPDPATVERWRPTMETIPGVRVGIAWQGNPEHSNDGRRSFRLADLAPLAEVPGVSFISLQKGYGTEQLAEAPFRVVDLGPAYAAGDWMDTAAIVSRLDLVIGCDSALAHLAGALGKPAWIALPHPADWRWARAGETTPWYASARLFRQDLAGGHWSGVFRRMAEALAGITSAG